MDASRASRDLAARQGLEPQLTDPESVVLPLDDRAIHLKDTEILSIIQSGVKLNLLKDLKN